MVMPIAEILAGVHVMPVLVVQRVEDAAPLARALVAGGLRALEVTLRTACALDAIEAMRQAVPRAWIGAGTVRCARDLAAAAQAGAQFAVSPGLTPELGQAATRNAIPFLPGVMTASEAMAALAAGFTHMKLFPAEPAGGRDLLRALAGPLPEARFCPTGGITPENASDYLALPNVVCVGGTWMAPALLIEGGDWAAIEGLAAAAAAIAPG